MGPRNFTLQHFSSLNHRKVSASLEPILAMRYRHTMIRVQNLDAALAFWSGILGLIETRRVEVPEGQFTLVFLAAPEDLEAEGLRTPEVAQAASKVAVIAEVRAALVDFQRAFARRAGGAVLDGRDIGTVICPNAPVKLYVTASAEVRAERRWKELVGNGHEISLDEVLADVIARDARDRDRAEAPMTAAEDAVKIDTSDMSIEEAVSNAFEAVRARQA